MTSMNRVLIIGAGAAGSVVAKKCAMNMDVFKHIHFASRRLESCVAVQKECVSPITISEVDADDTAQVIALIEQQKPDLLINMALPYQDLTLMDACLATGVHYMDTANYEPREEAKFAYHWQWAYQERFKDKGLMAILGCGFDPGVTNVFCAYARDHLFDSIEFIDIIDCNDGNHGKAFATNFNPEINLREVTQRGKYWKNGQWIEVDPVSLSCMIDYPDVGPRKSYLIYHEEEESLVQNIPGLKQIRFWMTFGDEYIKHLTVLQNVGMTRIDPVKYQGVEIIPLQFLKAVLPEPASLGPTTKGKTNIGCIATGIGKDGKEKTLYIYNICDHEDAYAETGSQAVSYTTGVPAMIGAALIVKGLWRGHGVFNMEQFNPDPFMDMLNQHGLPWQVKELEGPLNF